MDTLEKWECSVCGWTYEEVEGGRWEQVPATFICPDCNAGKSDFVKMLD